MKYYHVFWGMHDYVDGVWIAEWIYCIETVVLLRFKVSAQQRVYTPQYHNITIRLKSKMSINAVSTGDVERDGSIIINAEYIRTWIEQVTTQLYNVIGVDRLKVAAQNNKNYYNFA
jgi:hypothetical protein